MTHIFISYARENYNVVQRLIADLQNAEISVYVDQIGLKPGTPDWEQALRDAIDAAEAVVLIASPDSRRSPFVRDELSVAQATRTMIYPLWAVGDVWINCIPMGFGVTQYIDVRGDAYANGLQQLIDALQGKPVELVDTGPIETVTAPPPPDKPPRNPYKGLEPFRAEDRGDFFGRGALIAELVETLGTANGGPRFLAVIGPSGSGKSSVVMAGLLPALQDGALDGSAGWVYLEPMIPGAHPLENLAIRLARVLPHRAQRAILEDLQDPTTRGLHRVGSEVVKQTGGRLVLYIDQFEELFTLTQTENERQQFIDLLTTAACEPGGPVLVILSMRADFYDRPMQYGELCKLIESHDKAIPPLTLADLYEVVQEPAALSDVALEFDDGLVTELVFAVRDEIGGLPLLQFTLDQLFQHREGRCLTRAAYETIGGVRGALRSHAEATYAALPSDEHRQMVRALFLRLIEPGATEQDTTRRRASLTELDLPDAAKTRLIHAAADAFTTARLLVTGKSGEDTTIEVAHEALIREWKRLGGWLHDAREDVRLQKAISADAAEWVRRGRKPDDDMLYRGTVLDDARTWADQNAPSKDEVAFIEAAEEQQQRSQERERRRKRQLRWAWIAVLVAIIVFLVALVAIFSMENAGLQDDVKVMEARQERAEVWLTAEVGLVPFGEGMSDKDILATATRIAQLKAWEPVVREFDGVEMVHVPAGCFWMGSLSSYSDEQPVHEVCFEEDFWIDRYEVTNAQFAVFDGQAEAASAFEGEHRPREQITWYEAQAFCESRGAQLPTEAEWEYAARGPDSLIYPWGNKFEKDNVVYRGNSDNQTAPVGSRPDGVSWVGALDMSGNVWEWVADWYDPGYYRTLKDGAVDPVGPEVGDYRVLRGGGFNYDMYVVRATDRGWDSPTSRNDSDGFRCARSAED